MKELVVISGKGGTGKTSIVASFAALSKNSVLADCDVDAADLHLILEPSILYREMFSGGKRARILPENCVSCGRCLEVCRFNAIKMTENENKQTAYSIDPISCEGCGVCVRICPHEAIAFEPAINGEWYISRTRHGSMVHARLGIAEENSGKLVTIVRNQAKQLAEKEHRDMVIIDGSPGTGCPVIASITGASLVLIVTEPTQSGLHDLKRVTELAKHFSIPVVVCINKWDINHEITQDIEHTMNSNGCKVIGKIRYDVAVTKAQLMKASIVEYTGGSIAQEIQSLWRNVIYELG